MYIANMVLKKIVYNYFMSCYFNDLVCPFILLSYTNILFSDTKYQLKKITTIVLYCFVCGLLWEFASLNPNSVADFNDIICYVSGGIVYWILKYKLVKCITVKS